MCPVCWCWCQLQTPCHDKSCAAAAVSPVYCLPTTSLLLAAQSWPRLRASKVSVAACLLSPPRKSCRPRVSQQQVPRTARSWRAPAGRAARCRVTDLLQGYTLLGLWAAAAGAAALGGLFFGCKDSSSQKSGSCSARPPLCPGRGGGRYKAR